MSGLDNTNDMIGNNGMSGEVDLSTVPSDGGLEPDQGAQQPLSRRDAIAKALESRQTPSESQDGRPRDPQGRFAPTDQNAQGQQQPAQQPASNRKTMPSSWKKDYADKWNALPDDMANFLADLEDNRQREFMSGVEKYRTLNQYAEGIQQVLQPYEEMLKYQYGSVNNGLGYLMQLSDAASRDPAGFIKWFAQQRGIDLGGLTQAGQPSQQQPGNQGQSQVDPVHQQALLSTLQPWMQRLYGMEQQVQQLNQRHLAASEAQSLKVIEDFFSEKDELGSAKHEIDEGAFDDFVVRVQFHRNTHPDWDDRRVIDQAYQELSWVNENMRQRQLQAQEKARREKEAKEIAAKKQAAVSVKGAPSAGAATQVNPKDRRAIIEQAMSNLDR